jgi:hypothetical protein
MSIIFVTYEKVESMSPTLRFPNVRWESLLDDFTLVVGTAVWIANNLAERI